MSYNCDTMWPFFVLGECVCAGQRISLSALARNPHKGLRTRSPTRPEVEEERKVREKTEQELTKEDGERQSRTDSK